VVAGRSSRLQSFRHSPHDFLRIKQRKTRPTPTEYDAVFWKYINLVPDGDIVATLASQSEETVALLYTVPEDRAAQSYVPGKWSIKEVLGHLIDSERIFV